MDFYSASGITILWCCFFQTIAIGWIFGTQVEWPDFVQILPDKSSGICTKTGHFVCVPSATMDDILDSELEEDIEEIGESWFESIWNMNLSSKTSRFDLKVTWLLPSLQTMTKTTSSWTPRRCCWRWPNCVQILPYSRAVSGAICTITYHSTEDGAVYVHGRWRRGQSSLFRRWVFE